MSEYNMPYKKNTVTPKGTLTSDHVGMRYTVSMHTGLAVEPTSGARTAGLVEASIEQIQLTAPVVGAMAAGLLGNKAETEKVNSKDLG